MKRAELERAVADALATLDLRSRVEDALPRLRGGVPARIVAIGKAAPAMAAGAIARWQGRVEECLVVVPDGTDVTAVTRAAAHARMGERAVRIMRAGHPLPDARSVRAAEACLAAVSIAEARQVLVLVSGGASALVCAPSHGITLATKRAITRALLASGASVQDLNVVRKHLSRIKGGGLARAAAPNRVLTLVASDVIGGAASDVGSGPSVPDDSTIAEARRVLRKFAPSYANAKTPLVATLSPASRVDASRLRAKIVASPETLAREVARLFQERGVRARVLPPSQAPATELADEYLELVRRARTKERAQVFVRAAEPSVPVTRQAGRGGRCTHVAALVARGLGTNASKSAHVLFAALATDGIDGNSGTAGAIVTSGFSARVTKELGPAALDRAIARFDTGSLHLSLGTAVRAHPTGHNLTDLHVLAIG